jgi:hypothetical protein
MLMTVVFAEFGFASIKRLLSELSLGVESLGV